MHKAASSVAEAFCNQRTPVTYECCEIRDNMSENSISGESKRREKLCFFSLPLVKK